MSNNSEIVRDEDLQPDERQWLADDGINFAPFFKGVVAIGLLSTSILGGHIKNSIYPSPLFPSESCTTEKGMTVCTTDRGWWGNDTISFKPDQSKSAYEIEVKCLGNRRWDITAKHNEISNDIANKQASNWCKDY